MPAQSIHVAQLMLPFQTVGVGEAHDNPRGREKVARWIMEDWVSDLVVELPSFADDYTVASIDKKWPSRFLLSELLTYADRSGVRVQKWDDWHESGVHPASEDGMNGRNQGVAESFRAHFGGAMDAHHCVILFGAKHFRGAFGFEALLPGLKWADLSK